jgi:prophage regulatory protein
LLAFYGVGDAGKQGKRTSNQFCCPLHLVFYAYNSTSVLNNQSETDMHNINLKVLKKPEIKAITTDGNTAQFEKIRQGLLPPYFHLGKRSVGMFEHECITIVTARAAGKSDDEIRQIVKALIKQRETSANDLLKQLVA